MKRLLLLISFSILCLISFAQTNVQQDNRINPILKSALTVRSGYYIYGRIDASRFINIAVLNQSSHTLCWFTCHGRLFDSTKLTNQAFEQVASKQLDPFVLYQNICDKYLADIVAAKDVYRVYGDIKLFEKLNGNYRTLFAMEAVQAANTSLQKLMAIENAGKRILTQLAYLNCSNPSMLSHNPLYATSKEQAGIMVKTNDSTVYYNIDPTSAVAKIILYKKSSGKLYIQDRFSEIIDSVDIQKEKYNLLQKEKTDVFLLYRGWLEVQWQGALSAIRRQGGGLYNQVNVQNEEEVKKLYNQLNAIGAKINQLLSPEAKSIEQAVYDTYKIETSEINYIPLLGVGYSLTQTRGQKEYELSNHLGNVLATVSDKKIGVPSPSNSSLIDHYDPDVVSAQDYYPFGMLQPGRSFLSTTGVKYRYGFNGKENDSEVKGEGNQQDYGMRIYDPRLGRFLSVDPLTKSFPQLTPYQYASNTPIQAIDLDGLEKYHYLLIHDDQGKPKLTFLRTEHFTETTSDWQPTLKNPLNTVRTTVRDPKTEFIVHGQVGYSAGLDGDIDLDEDVTWTFQSYDGMRAAEANGGPGNLKHWSWMNSDQQMEISASIAIFNAMQAEGEAGGTRGLWRGFKYNFSVGASFGSRHMANRITAKSFAKEINTVGLKNANYKLDVEHINYGAANEIKDKTFGTIYQLKNGNRYYLDKGVLKPLQGGAYVDLTRSQFKALGLLNMTEGNINADQIQKPLGKLFSQEDLNVAIDVYNKSK